ncbi:hypothetical protein K3N28_12770 [Glycomyces sp. TRM65418]|uniref:hypothetical protein n=1 Tax=Glycomyces sp. TRM65418 TaxID=2867006 RepID=UPI001CE5E482|nr:hypothetical protein [Glycomyces sp. TRM65418]MCC3763938.1 hypothetical protein [Glycomyces sp. TRM65418]QZD53638.1 hypothetical protein K3N28_12700 [Glycomyces sp. TRM65418]
MALTTILDSGLPGNSRSGANSTRRPGVPAYLEQVVYAASVDANSPGAYRYGPESADPTIPDSDPRSPRYERPHLRHRPGDTWIVDRERPHDPLDPGPYGSPGWYADKRTGRHRRGELPDQPDEGRPQEPIDRRSPDASPETAGKPRATPGRSGDELPQPPRRPRFWEEGSDDRRYDFGKLREDAWSRFLVESQELHHAHLIQRVTGDDRWFRLWRALRAFLLRALGPRTSNRGAQVRYEPSTMTATPSRASGREALPVKAEWKPTERALHGKRRSAVVGTAKVNAASALSGTPSQGEHRVNPVNPFMAQWERHFDATQLFREAVTL